MSTALIPTQEKGKSVDLQEELETSPEAAKQIFKNAVYLLRRPGLWHVTAGALSASFSIDGKQQESAIQKGDYIRISIPGPGLHEGDGEDWVQVAELVEENNQQSGEKAGILLRVCPNPHNNNKAIAHFFAAGASSTLLVMRDGSKLIAQYKGRNELPNTEQLTLTDTVRNLAVAGGALAGISELQWKALLKGLLAEAKS